MESNPAKLAASKLVEDLMSGIACRSDGPSISPAYAGAGLGRKSSKRRRMLANRPRELLRDAFPNHSIGGTADCVEEALGLQGLVHRRRGEGGIGADVAPQLPVPVSVDVRLPHLAPAVGAMHVEISLPWNSGFTRRLKSTRLG